MSVNGSVTIGGVAYNSSGYAFPTIGGQTYYNTSAKWTAVNNSPTYYEWQVWTNSALTGTNFGTTGNVLSATSSWVQATYGSFAYWRVRGGNSAGAGPWSSPVLVI